MLVFHTNHLQLATALAEDNLMIVILVSVWNFIEKRVNPIYQAGEPVSRL
jgi:hypothetical protein